MLANHIKNATAREHLELESLPALKKLMSPELSKEEYIFILAKFWGFWSQLETMLQSCGYHGLADAQQRRRSHRLLEDLRNLGVAESPALCDGLDCLEDPLHLLGALYVYEGSSLGAQVIVRHLHSLGYDPRYTWYFSGYAQETGQRWKTFIDFLNDAGLSDEACAKVTDGARLTFKTLQRWISQS